MGQRARRDVHASLHPLSWGVWLACALIMVFLTSNPLHTVTIALCGLLVYFSGRSRGPQPLDYLLLLGLLFALLTVPLNLVMGSSGNTEMFSLPSLSFPRWLGGVTFGGTVTAESFVYALGRAASLGAILALVAAFNAGVDHFRLLKHLPAGLAQVGLICSIGLMLVPATLSRAQTLREARLVRGYPRSAFRSFPAIALPLLTDALERSVQRAESLDARGFGRIGVEVKAYEGFAGVAAVTLAAVGAFAYYYSGLHLTALSLLALGGAGLLVVLLRQNARSKAVRPSGPSPSLGDLAAIGGAVAALAIFVFLRVNGSGELSYLPFPDVAWPSYHPLAAGACLMLLAPALGNGER